MKIEIHLDKEGQYYFIMRARNGRAICRSSESYVRRNGVEKAISLVLGADVDTRVVDLTRCRS